jgi:myo-inositol-1(or 4)-monophosphatase
VWVIDPIDGTHFLTGIPFWCVSLGLVVGGEFVLGIIYAPVATELYSARKGGGAYLNGKPIRVSGEAELGRARVSVGFSYRRPVAQHTSAIDALLAAGCEYLRLGSGALGLAYPLPGASTATGRATRIPGTLRPGPGARSRSGRLDERFPWPGPGSAEGSEVLAATPALVAAGEAREIRERNGTISARRRSPRPRSSGR